MDSAAICAAISTKAIVELSYGDGITRIVEPHRHGTGADGSELLHAYQTAGPSMTGRAAGWKLFKIARITAFCETGERFHVRADYNPQWDAISVGHCSV